MSRLAIITTHPIQYYAPLFRLLNQRKIIDIKVFYTFNTVDNQFDEGFGKEFSWDIPLLEGYDYTFVSNKCNGRKGFWNIKNPNLINEIKDWGADAILVFGWNYYSHLKLMMYFKNRIPVLFRGDSTILDDLRGINLKKYLRRFFLKWVYQYIDIGLYVGECSKEYFLKHGLKIKQLYFAPHAIDNERFKNLNKEQQKWVIKKKTELSINEEDITFLFCGKFQIKKNPLLLINAFKKLENEKMHLILVGNGELETKIKHAINGNSNIHVLPFQNQSVMPAVYRLGDVFCLPSQGPGETWGLAVNEAMACGIPCIVSNKVGCSVDLINRETGWVFESNNVDVLYNIFRNIVDKHETKQMGKNASEFIAKWNFENISKKIEEVCLILTQHD